MVGSKVDLYQRGGAQGRKTVVSPTPGTSAFISDGCGLPHWGQQGLTGTQPLSINTSGTPRMLLSIQDSSLATSCIFYSPDMF